MHIAERSDRRSLKTRATRGDDIDYAMQLTRGEVPIFSNGGIAAHPHEQTLQYHSIPLLDLPA